MATILIADDTLTEAALIESVVKQLGHTAIVVTDGEACLATARNHKPALILLDVVMPKMDGFKTCRSIKKDPALAGVPVVLVTSKSQESDRFWGERQGADHYVTKPFTPDTLGAAIRAFLN